MAHIAIYTEDKGPRALYILNHVFARMLGWSIDWLKEESDAKNHEGPLVVYSSHADLPGFRVAPSTGLRRGASLDGKDVIEHEGQKVLYATDGDWPFDLFAFAFFLLSRSEEYAGSTDAHGRFDETRTWVVQHDCADTPILDEWVMRLASELRRRWPSLPEPKREFRMVQTFDMDNGFKYLGREGWRSLGAAARDLLKLRLGEVLERIQVLQGSKEDPYHLVQHIQKHTAGGGESYCFFLAADRGPNDHAVPPEHPRMRKKVEDLGSTCTIGIHPSYRTMEDPQRIGMEKARLEAVCQQPVHASRQHFLRFRLPETYRYLLAHGIGEEHSMGFSRRPGFRAGTGTPFPWYDLEAEEETQLIVHPFALMDSAIHHFCLAEKKSVAQVYQNIISNVSKVKGCCELIWHERFMAGDMSGNEWDRIFIDVTASGE